VVKLLNPKPTKKLNKLNKNHQIVSLFIFSFKFLSRVFCLQALCFLPKGSLVGQQEYVTLPMWAFEGASHSIITRGEHCSFWDLYTICKSLNKGQTQQQRIHKNSRVLYNWRFLHFNWNVSRFQWTIECRLMDPKPNSQFPHHFASGCEAVFFFLIGNWNRNLVTKGNPLCLVTKDFGGKNGHFCV